jgi:VWFA-related protein
MSGWSLYGNLEVSEVPRFVQGRDLCWQLANSAFRHNMLDSSHAPGRPMISRRFTPVLAVVICSTSFFYSLQTQAQSAAQTPPDQSTYTFHADTRVVLTDVTVTDANGNPVHGLPQSAFRIFDNKQPQVIASFDEHAGIPAPTILPERTSGVYSNDYLLHLPPVLNIILIDIANIDMADQMYLNYELTKLLNEQPEGQLLAIYLRAGSGCFLVQNFTSDRKLLLDAVHKAIPRFPPAGHEYLNDFDTLQQMAIALSQLPGRKNVLWFSGGSTVFLIPDAIALQNDADWRALYDDLDQERIAIYPIDARGLTVNFSNRMIMAMAAQHTAMNNVAQATGGQGFYDNNGLKEATEHFLSSDTSFYTLTYSPHELHFDNKWHKVRVAVDGGPYHLSYRSGYFADGSLHDTDQPAKSRTRLLANGEKLEITEQSRQPIIFQASVLPASDPSLAKLDKPSGSLPPPPAKRGTVPFSVRYTVPIDAFTMKHVDGKHQVVFGVAVIALNRYGSLVERDAQQVTMTFKEEVFRHDPNLPIVLDQQLNLAKGDTFLSLGLWDITTGRAGSIQIPLEVLKPSRHQQATGTN